MKPYQSEIIKSPKSVTTVSMSKVETIQLFIQNIPSHLISDAMHWRLGILWQKETKGRGGMAGNQDQLHIRLWQNEKYVIVQTDWPFEFDCDHYTTSSCGNNKMQKKLRWEYGCQFLKEDIKCHHWKVRMKSLTFPSHFFTFSYCSSYMCIPLDLQFLIVHSSWLLWKLEPFQSEDLCGSGWR